jgi:hypothetical protein
MSRVITFSRTFPSYHPKKGQPTYFIEKIWKSLGGVSREFTDPFVIGQDFKKSIVWGYQLVEGVKYHTIRSGKRWKVGDKFSPRVWSGKPYNSKMITIAPDIEIRKVWDFEMDGRVFYIDGKYYLYTHLNEVATNDGLILEELLQWFKYPGIFQGQIICWNENINY